MAKPMLKSHFIVLSTQEQESSQISNVSSNIKKLEKDQNKSKVCTRKEIINVRVNIIKQGILKIREKQQTKTCVTHHIKIKKKYHMIISKDAKKAFVNPINF